MKRTTKKSTTKEFVEKSNVVHKNRYDYSLVEYTNNKTKVKIICPIHGMFEQKPNNHLSGQICYMCAYPLSGKENFIEMSNKLHNFKYDYSLICYKSNKIKVDIICPKHGIFKQTTLNHLNTKIPCVRCSAEERMLSQEEALKKFNKAHNGRYDYSLVEYYTAIHKVKIICKEHGIFEQKPESHMNGIGCPKCNKSKGEILISKILDDNNIEYIEQFKFEDCKDVNTLKFDFYLPKQNICIEFNGKQHYKSVKFFGGEDTLSKQKRRDKIKSNYCKENNIQLLVFTYKQKESNIISILEGITSVVIP